MVDAAPDAVGSRHMYMGHRRSGVGKLGRAGGLEGREVPADFVRSPAVERYIAERASGTSYSKPTAFTTNASRRIPACRADLLCV